VVLVVLMVLAMLLGGGYAAAYVGASDKIPRGTRVAGVDVGGRSLAQATAVLRDGLRERANTPITLAVGGERSTALPAELGLGIDYVASVQAAGAGRSWEPERLWNYYTGGQHLQAVVTVSQITMDDYLASLAQRTGAVGVDGAVRFFGQRIVVRNPRTGRSIDAAQARQAIVSAFLSDDPTARIDAVPTQPDIDEADVREAVRSFANPALAGPVTLVLGDVRVTLQPRNFAATLSMQPRDGRLVPHVDRRRLLDLVDQAIGDRARPRDAVVAMIDGRPKVVPARDGIDYDPDSVSAAFVAALAQPLGSREGPIDVTRTPPELDNRDARRLRIHDKVATYTTSYPHSPARDAELGRVAGRLDGTVLEPGDTFSFLSAVGVGADTDGTSQAATAVYVAAFLAGLDEVERHAQPVFSGRYPAGRDAVVSEGQDLRFANSTPYGVLVQAAFTPSTASSPGSFTVTLWSTAYWTVSSSAVRSAVVAPGTQVLDTPDCTPVDGRPGFDVDVTRHFHLPSDPSQDHDEVTHTTYVPSDAVVCEN
jgi:vancomycin resistance protein YoaR